MAVPTPLSAYIEEVRYYWYRKGKEAGMKLRGVIYSQCCEAHHARLILGKEPGTFICMICQIAAQQQPTVPMQAVPNPEIERDTDRIAPVSDRPFLQWRQERHQDTGPHTQLHRAVQLRKG